MMKFSQVWCTDREYLGNGGFSAGSMEAVTALELRREVARLLDVPPESIGSNTRWRKIRQFPTGEDIEFDDVYAVLWVLRKLDAWLPMETAEQILPGLDDDDRTLEQSAQTIAKALRASGIEKVRKRNAMTEILESPLKLLAWLLVVMFGEFDDFLPGWRRIMWGFRGLLYLCPFLLIALFIGVKLPRWCIPLVFFGTFLAVVSLVGICANRRETPPEPVPESEEAEPEEAKMPVGLLCYAGLLLIPVLSVTIPYFTEGDWHRGTIFFLGFGTVLCLVATGGACQIGFRGYAFFCGAVYTVVAVLWMFQVRDHVFPFFWTLFAFVFTALLFLDKEGRFAKANSRTNRRLGLIVGSLFCVIGVFFSAGGIRNAMLRYDLGHAPVSTVREIVLTDQNSSRRVTLDNPVQIARFQWGIATAYAFSNANRRDSGRTDLWDVRFCWQDGREQEFTVANGTHRYPDAAFIRLSGDYQYQSRALYKMLRPLLWPETGK